MTTRTADPRVLPLIVDRWSPRAFDGAAVPAEDLAVIFEAAGLAPSAFNYQPWRFLYAVPGDANWAAFLDILIAFPTLLLAMLIVAAQGASLGTAILAIGLAMSAVVARLTRVLAKRVLAQQYVTAARTSGTSWPGVVARHVLPNIWPTLGVNLALQFGVAVLAEASLSYLGLGAPPPNASWGRMLQEAQGTVAVAPVGAIAPGIALVVLVIGVNLVADGLRDVADPTRRRSR